MVLPDSLKQMPLRFVPWPWLPREAVQFPIRLFLPILPARRVSSAPPVLPVRLGKFRSAHVFPGSRVNLRARFPAATDFLSGTARPFRQFSCVLLQTIFLKPAPAVLSIQFLCVPFRGVFPAPPGFLFPSSPFAPRSLCNQAQAALGPSSPSLFLRASRAPAYPARRLHRSSPQEKIAAR